jgi:K+-transporting ATPase ATPase B chain
LKQPGDLDTLLLDKTGTITIGNRKATHFYPTAGIEEKTFVEACLLSSLADETPEGKSIIELTNLRRDQFPVDGAKFIVFTAETRSSGIDLPTGIRIRKGAYDSILKIT